MREYQDLLSQTNLESNPCSIPRVPKYDQRFHIGVGLPVSAQITLPSSDKNANEVDCTDGRVYYVGSSYKCMQAPGCKPSGFSGLAGGAEHMQRPHHQPHTGSWQKWL